MFLKRISILLIAVLPMLWACKEEKATPSTTLTARAGNDRDALVGEKVLLDGSASTDSDGTPFSFRWAFTGVPQGSIAVLAADQRDKPYFTPDKPGAYEITLTIENDNGKSQDKVIVNAAIAQPVELTGPVTTPTVLVNRISNPDLPDYVVTSDLSVASELTIEPGVVIAFHRDKRMEVQENGTLIVQGEAEKHVVFTGLTKTKGFWAGVLFRSAGSANSLDHLVIEYAGSRPLSNNLKAGFFMTGGSKASMALRNTRFLHNDGYGLYLQEGAGFSTFARNHFEGNTLTGLQIDANTVSTLDRQTTFTGNGSNAVEIAGSTLEASPSGTQVWKKFSDGTPYRIIGQLGISGALQWEAGTKFELEQNGSISINASGWLEARGTPDSKIRISGKLGELAGYWKGIICYSPHNTNVFEHVEIVGGGSTPIVSGKKTTIAVYGSHATMTIRNSRISHSGGYGAYVNYQADINADFETANVFEKNQQANLLRE